MEPGRRALIPYEEDRTVLPQPARWGTKLAHASWLNLAALGLLLRIVEGLPRVQAVAVWIGLTAGIAAGVAALIRTRWEGREGIARWALMGLTLNLFAVLLFVGSYLVQPTVLPE